MIAAATSGRARAGTAMTWASMDNRVALIEEFDLRGAEPVARSNGACVVTCFLGGHDTTGVAEVVLAVPFPLMLNTRPIRSIVVVDATRKATQDDRAQFFRDLTLPFDGCEREGAKKSHQQRHIPYPHSALECRRQPSNCIPLDLRGRSKSRGRPFPCRGYHRLSGRPAGVGCDRRGAPSQYAGLPSWVRRRRSGLLRLCTGSPGQDRRVDL